MNATKTLSDPASNATQCSSRHSNGGLRTSIPEPFSGRRDSFLPVFPAWRTELGFHGRRGSRNASTPERRFGSARSPLRAVLSARLAPRHAHCAEPFGGAGSPARCFLYIHRKNLVFDFTQGTVASWVLQAAYSKALNRRKRFHRDPSAPPIPIGVVDRLRGSEIDSQRVMDRLTAEELLRLAIAELTEHQRETLWLHFSDGYTLREIGVKRKERMENTRHHYYRGIENLRRAIAKAALIVYCQVRPSSPDRQYVISVRPFFLLVVPCSAWALK